MKKIIYERWFTRISIIGLIVFTLYLWQTRPLTIETTRIYYAIIENGEVRVEKTDPNMSMGCNAYWRIKGFPCYEIKN